MPEEGTKYTWRTALQTPDTPPAPRRRYKLWAPVAPLPRGCKWPETADADARDTLKAAREVYDEKSSC